MDSLKELFASPFTGTDDDIDPTTKEGKEVLSQPPATKWELWGYYLYYNGVCINEIGALPYESHELLTRYYTG